MSKNNLKVGVIYVLLGCLLAVYAILTPESKLNSLLNHAWTNDDWQILLLEPTGEYSQIPGKNPS